VTPVRRSAEEDARITREITARAIRRLDILEWVILTGVAALSVVGGWLVALVLSTAVGLPFRPVWIAAAVLIFSVPGAIAWRRTRREDRQRNQSTRSDDIDV
jgi:uncharacterized membrane protein